jgi:hypothetical protein
MVSPDHSAPVPDGNPPSSMLVVFLCFQRYFLKGSLSGGVKG